MLYKAKPLIMAEQKMRTFGTRELKETIAGPGQNPLRPHPNPKSAAPKTIDLSILVFLGVWREYFPQHCVLDCRVVVCGEFWSGDCVMLCCSTKDVDTGMM